MTNVVIRTENLGKEYLIGGSKEPYTTLRDSVMAFVRSPFRRSRPSSQRIWALKNVSFEVKQGDAVGIIGRNGAGKSTILKVLSRITEPSEGRVKLSGRTVSLLEVGTGFHPELTGRENIYLNGAILGMTKTEIKSRFDQIVDFAEIEMFLDTPVKRYSSGMYMRLAFAVAAHLDAEILLVDEVLAVGDAQFQKKCMGRMETISQGGRTILFVSHNMNAIEKLCTSAFLLEGGKLTFSGPNVGAVIREYLFRDEETVSEWTNRTGEEYENPWFKPLRLAITDQDGTAIQMPISNTAEAWVWLEGEVESNDPALTVGYAAYDEEGRLLYWSYQTDQPENKWPRLERGKCVLASRIPKKFFNEGHYRIELIASLHFRQWLLEPGRNCPSVRLTIQAGLSDSPYWIAKRPGILAPEIEWIRL